MRENDACESAFWFHYDTHYFITFNPILSSNNNLLEAGAPADVISAGRGVVLDLLVLECQLSPESGVTRHVLETATSERYTREF